MTYVTVNSPSVGSGGGGVGPAGPAGPAGVDGHTILNGTGAPANTLGNDDDFYIDTAAKRLYGPKTLGAWPGTSISLVGPQGIQGIQGVKGDTGAASTVPGPQGESGNTINTVSGAGVPSNTVGKNGDYALNITSYTLYGPKVGGAYPSTGTSLIGPQGPAGSGATGPLSDIVVRSAGSTNVTLDNQVSRTNFPTTIYQGTFSAADNVSIYGQTLWNTVNTANGALFTVYRFRVSGPAPGTPTFSLDNVYDNYNLLAFDDNTKVAKVSGTASVANGTTGTTGRCGYGFNSSANSGFNYNPARSGVSAYVGGNEIGYWDASGYKAVVGSLGSGGGAPNIITIASGNRQLTAAESGSLIVFTGNAQATLPPATAGNVNNNFFFTCGVANITPGVYVAANGGADFIYTEAGTFSEGQLFNAPANTRAATIWLHQNVTGSWVAKGTSGGWGTNPPQFSIANVGSNYVFTATQNNSVAVMNQPGTGYLPLSFVKAQYTVTCSVNTDIAMQSQGGELIYWGGPITAGSPTNKQSGTNFTHLGAKRSARIRVRCETLGEWYIDTLIASGSGWV